MDEEGKEDNAPAGKLDHNERKHWKNIQSEICRNPTSGIQILGRVTGVQNESQDR